MAINKNFINVPFAQKDEAKDLGAKWDATQKKWYFLDDKDLRLFSKWQSISTATGSVNTKNVVSPNSKTLANKSLTGTVTISQYKDFVSYNDKLPPWH